MLRAWDETIEHLVGRLQSEPNDTDAYSRLKALYRDRGDYASLTNLVSGWANVTPHPAERADALAEVGDLLHFQHHRPEQAVAYYKEALSTSPLHEGATTGLQTALEALGDYRTWAAYLTSRLKVLADHRAPTGDRALLCYQLGEIWRNHLADPQQALKWFRRAHELDPTLLIALYEARQLMLALGRFADAAQLLHSEIEAEDNIDRRQLLLIELADLSSQQLEDLDGAVEALSGALPQAQDAGQLKYELAELLAERARRGNGGQAEDDRRRAAGLLLEVAQTQPDERAIEYLLLSLEHSPGHEEALDRAESLAKRLGRPVDLTAAWSAYLDRHPDGPLADERRLQLTRARITQGDLQAARAQLEILQTQGHAEAHALTSELELKEASMRNRGELPRAPQQPTGNLAGASSPPPDVPTPRKSADVEAELEPLRERFTEALKAKSSEEAADTAWRILWLDGTDRETFNFLDGHLRRTRDHRARCRLLEQTANANGVARETKVLRLREAAGLYESRLREVDRAVGLWKRIAQLDPEVDEAQRNLKRLDERIERWERQQRELQAELRAARSDGEREYALRRLLDLNTRQRADHFAAIDILRELLASRPSDSASLQQTLSESQIQVACYDDAVETLRALAAQQTGPEWLETQKQLADLLHHRKAELYDAYEIYSTILDRTPEDRAVLRQKALIEEKREQFRPWLHTMERLQALADTPEEVANIQLRMAEVAADKLGDSARALRLLRDGVRQHPGHRTLTAALINQLEVAGDYAYMAELLKEQIAEETATTARARLMHRAAEVLKTHLGDDNAARQLMETLLDEQGDSKALRYLEHNARKHGDHTRLVQLLARRLREALPPDEELSLRMERATLLHTTLSRHTDAIVELGQLLDRLAPSHSEALDLLEDACIAEGRFEPLCRALEQALDASEDKEQQVAVASRLADLYQNQVPSPKRAIAALLRLSALRPNEVSSYRDLRPLQTAQGQHEDLLATLDALSRLEPETEDQLEATIAAADLCAEKLEDIDGALKRLTEPTRRGASAALDAYESLAFAHDRLNDLVLLLQESGQTEPLFSVLEKAAESSSSDEERVDWLRYLARSHLRNDSPTELVSDVYLRLLELREDQEALQYLLDIARERDDTEQIAELLGRLCALTPDKQTRRDMRLEQASLLLSPLQRPAAAAHAFRTLLADGFPNDPSAIDGLITACRQAGDHAGLVAVLEQELDKNADGDRAARFAKEIAGLYMGPLKQPQRALPSLRRWRSSAPGDLTPLRKLRQTLTQTGQERELLSTLDSLSGLEPEEAERAQVVVAAARLARTALQDDASAFRRLSPWAGAGITAIDQELRLLADQGVQFFDELCALYERAGRHDALFSLIEQRLVQLPEDDRIQAALLHRRAARLAVQPLDRPDRAEHHYRALLAVESDVEALRFMRARAMAVDDPKALCQYIERLASNEPDAEARRDLLFEQAHILRVRLNRPDNAVALLRQLVHDHPNYVAGLEELCAACEDAADPVELTNTLERLLSLETDADECKRIASRLLSLYSGPLLDPRSAIPALRTWAQAKPRDPEPYRHLRGLLDPTTEAMPLLQVLDTLSTLETDPERRDEACLAAASLCTQEPLSDLDGAFARLLPLASAGQPTARTRVVELAQQHHRLDVVFAHYESQGCYDDLAELLRDQARLSQDRENRITLYRRCAQLLASRLQDPNAAAGVYRELLQLDEDLEALHYLVDQARSQGKTTELVDLLERIAAVSQDHEEVERTIKERARLLHGALGESDAAIALLKQAEQDHPNVTGYSWLDERIALSETAHRPAELAQALTEKLQRLSAAESKEKTLARLADLYGPDGPVPDEVQLQAVLRHWTEVNSSEVLPRRMLLPLLTGKDQIGERLSTLDFLAQHEVEHEARVNALIEAAKLCSDALDDGSAALSRLSPLFMRREPGVDALMSDIADRHGLMQRLAAAYVQRAQHYNDPLASATDWASAADLYETSLDQPKEAFEAALRMLATDTENLDYLDHVDRLAVVAGELPRLTQVYSRILDATSSVPGKVHTALRLSSLLDENGEHDKAMNWAMKAARISPSDPNALAAAHTLAEQHQSYEDQVWLIEQRVHNEKPNQQVALLLQAGHIASVHLGDHERAHTLLTQALQVAGESDDLLSQIEAAGRTLDERIGGAHEALRTLVRAYVDGLGDKHHDRGPATLRRAARLLREDLRDLAGTYDVLRQGSNFYPEDAALLDELEETAVQVRRCDGLDAHLSRLAERQESKTTKRKLLLRRARLLSERLQRYDSAARVYGSVLDLDPEDDSVHTARFEALYKAARYQELLRAYDRRLRTVRNHDIRVALLKRKASLWENELRNRASALAVWKEVQRLVPDEAEAIEATARLRSHK